MHPPPAVPPEVASLLAWSARLGSGADAARAQAAVLRERVDERGLTGPAGDALAALGAAVSDQLLALARQCRAAAWACAEQAHLVAGEAR